MKIRLTMVVLVLGAPISARACAVCFGAPGSDVSGAMSMAILFMLGILLSVLGGFVAFFLYLRKKASEPPPGYLELAGESLRREFKKA